MKGKKRTTLVMAIVCGLALIITGTSAWIMAKDATKLNNFIYEGHSVDTDLDVSIAENFDHSDPKGKAWENKDVWIENNSAEDVIIRVRFEETMDITGALDSSDNTGGPKVGIFGTDGSFGNLSGLKGVSRVKPDTISFYFQDRVIKIDDWNSQKENEKEPYWIMDDDGWFYYSTYLKGKTGDTATKSRMLLDRVGRLSDEDMETKYGGKVRMDYHINIRLQAISADFTYGDGTYGKTDVPEQWTYTKGRTIFKNTDPDISKYESGIASRITPEGDAIVMAINNRWKLDHPGASTSTLSMMDSAGMGTPGGETQELGIIREDINTNNNQNINPEGNRENGEPGPEETLVEDIGNIGAEGNSPGEGEAAPGEGNESTTDNDNTPTPSEVNLVESLMNLT